MYKKDKRRRNQATGNRKRFKPVQWNGMEKPGRHEGRKHPWYAQVSNTASSKRLKNGSTNMIQRSWDSKLVH